MSKLSATIIVASMLSGCAGTSQTYMPDGSVGHNIDCSGPLRNWGMCYEAAGEVCGPSGYTVIGKQSDQESGSAINISTEGGSGANGRSMQVVCNTHDG